MPPERPMRAVEHGTSGTRQTDGNVNWESRFLHDDKTTSQELTAS